MNDKERQRLLDQALDRVMSGPIGQNKQAYWNKVAAISSTRSPDVRAKAMKSIDWDKRNKALGKSRKGKLNKGLQKHNINKRVPISVYKCKTNGKKKQNLKFIYKTFYKEYESIYAASLDTKVGSPSILQILDPNTTAVSYKGFTFEYA